MTAIKLLLLVLGQAIVPSNYDPKPSPMPKLTSISLTATQYELLTLTDYVGKVTWYVSDSSILAVYRPQPKDTILGVRAGSNEMTVAKVPDDKPTAVIYAKAKGQTKITAWGLDKEGYPYPVTSITVITDGTAPTPGPGPGPGPGPKPKVDKVFLVMITKAGDPPPNNGIVTGDIDYWEGIRTNGHDWRRYSSDSPHVASYKLDKDVGTVGYPALVALDMKGNLLKVTKLPATTAEIDAIIKELTQ